MEVPKVGRWWDNEYAKRQEILKYYSADQSYMTAVAFKRGYANVVFYSQTPVRQVPVCGYLFPVSMFNEEKIERNENV